MAKCWFISEYEEIVDSCTEEGIEIASLELPLWEVKDYVTQRIADRHNRKYERTVPYEAIEPATRGCFLVIKPVLCKRHLANIYWRNQ